MRIRRPGSIKWSDRPVPLAAGSTEAGVDILGNAREVGAHQAVTDVDQRRHGSLDVEQLALEPVDPLGGVAAERLTEDVRLGRLKLVLEDIDDREIPIDDEVHQRVEHESWTLGDRLWRGLTARAYRGA
jgi:hypothetical protein